MPVPGGDSGEPPAATPARTLTDRDMDRLAETWLQFPYGKLRKRPSRAHSLLRGMTFAFRPRRMPKPTFIHDDALAIALDWYMVGKDMRTVMGDFARESEAVSAGDRPRP